MIRFFLLAPALAFVSVASVAQTPARDPLEQACAADAVHLLILGTYHMDNPGLDAVNIEADDVLAPRRQAEIAELNAKLLAYRPTKVAVEGDRSRSIWNDRYRDWSNGRYSLGRNEIEQIGMRVARSAGHRSLYPIDFPMMMSGLRFDEVEFKPKTEAAKGGTAAPRTLSAEEQELRRLSVIENLRRINRPTEAAADHRRYMDLLLPDPNDAVLYGKADTLTNWYKRNIRMMTNIARISVPGDRVLLIVGSGHLAILRDFAANSERFCLADTRHYLNG